MAFDAFISYAHRDKAIADAACATLEAAGTRCWIAPRDVAPGTQWAAAIVDAIDHCRVIVLIFSSEANLSNQIHREVERAVSKGIPIIPLRIEEVQPTSSMEYFLGSIHWLDALTPPLEQHLQRLVEAVKACLDLGAGAAGTGPAQAPPSAPASRSARRNEPSRRRKTALVAALCCLLAVAGAGLVYYRYAEREQAPPAAQGAISPGPQQASEDVRRFDGVWIATLVCNRTPTLPGWRNEFVGRVENGRFHGQRGKEGQPGSDTYEGTIKPDGSAEITQNGLSGHPETDPFHRPAGTEYHNAYVGKLEGSHGTLTRLDRASCTIDLVTQAEAQGSSQKPGQAAPR
jgi:hypothetical protein